MNVVSTPCKGVPHFAALAAGETGSIPVGAFNWTVTILTGTATIGGLTVPAGFSDSDAAELETAIEVVTGTPGTAYIRYST
jgi:hypothetical protein